ncbi:MAG: DEAD/DEAH box helicase [Candidatus Aenigmarchaeota archaeon]|nr:DEAD/DEAH box helicase [Candidatus Aenigmarchaeota archaeon]
MDVFSLLTPKLQKLVRARFDQPTGIQKKAIPLIHAGKDVLILSETGSGKTESVFFPVIDNFLRKEHSPIAILYITPLKSLNRDLLKRLEHWAAALDFEVAVRHGDTSQYERSMQAQNPSEMFIVTPETLQAMLVAPLLRQHLAHVKWVIVDEIHELVDNKRGVQLSLGLERLRALAGGFQLIGLSATVGSPERVARFLGEGVQVVHAEREKRVSIQVDLPPAGREARDQAGRLRVSPETAARVQAIADRIRARKAVLVFTNTRESAEVLSSRLKLLDPRLPVDAHHSSLSKEVRIQAEQDFKDLKVRALLCTSSLELGIDIGAIDFVLQYLSPRQVSKLLQRVGRAGHTLKRVSEGEILAGDADDCFESTVIARQAMGRQIEETGIYEKALDILGHQLVGLTLERQEVPLDQAYQLVRKAYPYRDLSPEEFFQVCQLMERLGGLWINDRDQEVVERYKRGETSREDRFKDRKPQDLVLRRRRGAWMYYYGNLSSIPDVKSYRIVDAYTNQPVGTLDAEFIALHGQQGQGFIVKGQAWRILDVGERQVTVEPMGGIEAAIPAWEGELIPVPFAIAQGVGSLRREIASLDRQDPVPWLMEQYPVTRAVAKRLLAAVKEQQAWGPLPTDQTLLLEYDAERLIIHTCWGSLVNDSIGRALSVLLADRGSSVGLQTDPYRIVLALGGSSWKEAAELFLDLRPERMERALRESVPGTELFMWRFLHVAQRLGIIDRKAEFGKGYLKKVVEAYQGTPAWDEAVNEVVQDKLDIATARELLRQLAEKKFTVILREGISPLGLRALEKKGEIIPSDRPEGEIFGMYKKRLLQTPVGLVCAGCGTWAAILPAGEAPDKIACKRCKTPLVAVVPPRYLVEAQALVQKRKAGKRLSAEEGSWLERLDTSANLVLASGKDAAIALAGRGVGPRTAARLLQRAESGDDLIRSVLQAERNFIKTRRFWQGRE